MLKAARCLTVQPGQSIQIETASGETITLNVISAVKDQLRVEVVPKRVESVTVQASYPVRAKALTRGNCWKHHPDKGEL